MKLIFCHIWQLGGYGMVQNDATGCGNHFHPRPGHSRKFTVGYIFEPLLNLCWTFVGWTNSWPWRPRIGPTNQQRFNKGSENASKSQAVLGSVHVQGQSRSSDGATAWTRPRPGPSTILGHKFDRGAVPSLLLSAGCWICSE